MQNRDLTWASDHVALKGSDSKASLRQPDRGAGAGPLLPCWAWGLALLAAVWGLTTVNPWATAFSIMLLPLFGLLLWLVEGSRHALENGRRTQAIDVTPAADFLRIALRGEPNLVRVVPAAFAFIPRKFLVDARTKDDFR